MRAFSGAGVAASSARALVPTAPRANTDAGVILFPKNFHLRSAMMCGINTLLNANDVHYSHCARGSYSRTAMMAVQRLRTMTTEAMDTFGSAMKLEPICPAVQHAVTENTRNCFRVKGLELIQPEETPLLRVFRNGDEVAYETGRRGRA